MSRSNYRSYYKEKENNEDVKDDIVEDVKDNVEDDIIEDVKDDIVEDVKDNVEDDIIEDVNDDVESDEITIGVVVNCTRLNVRGTANRLSKVLTVIEKGTSVIIEDAKPSNGFYKVKVDDIEGYCVKDYIEIR